MQRRTLTIMTWLLVAILAGCNPPPAPGFDAGAPAPTVASQPTTDATAEAAAETAPPRTTRALLERPCDAFLPRGEVEGETIQCGYARVPWDRNDPGSAITDLAYAILKATGSNPQPDAIVHISGGPGAGATLRDVVPEMIQRYAPLRVERDIVLYDQRGMGRSQPFFSCPYPDEAEAAAVKESMTAAATEPVGDADVVNTFCQQELAAQGYPASGISTTNSAADLEDIMAALGYPAYNLYGISYGTRLAMSLMHHFPAEPMVRSVVLDSPYPLPEDQVNDFSAGPLLYQQAMSEAVFAACQADEACARDYPDLLARFDALVAKLDAAPLDLGDGQAFGGDDLYRSVYPFNSALNHIPYQPRLIAELENGDTATLRLLRSGEVRPRDLAASVAPDVAGFSDLLDAYLECTADTIPDDQTDRSLVLLWDGAPDAVTAFVETLCPGERAAKVGELVNTLAPGAFNGIIVRFAPELVSGVNGELNIKLGCTEQFPFREDPHEIEAALRAAGLPGYFVDDALMGMASNGDGCMAWLDMMTTPTPSTYGVYPVLILNGQFDNLTPPQLGQIAAEQLPDAQLVEVPNAAHSILGNHGDCPTQLVKQFLADPGRPVDKSCADDMRVQFLAPSAAGGQNPG